MKLAKWASAAVAGAMMMAAPNAGAVVVLDQLSQVPDLTGYLTVGASVGYFDPTFSLPPLAGSRFAFSQSMTAGTSGKIDHINFSHLYSPNFYGVPNSGSLVVSLIDGDYAAGSRKIVGQSMIDFSSLGNGQFNSDPTIMNFTFQTNSFNYRVKIGHTFSVLFDTTPDVRRITYFNRGFGVLNFGTIPPVVSQYYGPNYTGGKFQFYQDGIAVTPPEDVADSDLIFATYVDTSGAVPEPSTWSLLILGFGGIGAALRKQARRRARRTATLTAA